MAIITQPDLLPEGSVAVTIGMFDGVHRGHVWLIDCLKRSAAERHLTPAVVTFREHPRNVLCGEGSMKLIMPLDRCLDLLAATGIGHIILMDFTPSLSQLDSGGFMSLLNRSYGTAAVLMGYNHKFGHNRNESFADYVSRGKALGVDVERAAEYSGEYAPVSSSIIRQLIESGDVAAAAGKLGGFFSLRGTVVHGFARGRHIGFPTANIATTDASALVPADGVYAVEVVLHDGSTRGGMANIGIRPTFDDGMAKSVEIHIFDFDADIYGKVLTVNFVARLRDEIAMKSVDELKSRLAIDLEAAKSVLSRIVFTE